jgi:hypothetical protein
MTGLPTGRYTLRVEKEGFQTEVREGIVLSPGSAIEINLSLVVGQVSVHVTVDAGVPVLDTTSTVGGTIAERSVTALPLDSRDLFKAAVLQPGTVPTPSSAPSLLSNGKAGQVSFDGMRPSWTNVLIDGMDANDPVFGYSPAGASGLFLGLDDFVEVRVLTRRLTPNTVQMAGASSRRSLNLVAISFTDRYLNSIVMPRSMQGTISMQAAVPSHHSCATNLGPVSVDR